MRAKISFLILLFFTSIGLTKGQTLNNPDAIVKATDFSIPSSPAFSLLEMNPEKVNSPGFLRDFKVDWVMSDNSLKPNIAIEAQPIWLLFYNDVNLNAYQKKSWADRTLSTLNISMATAQKNSINSFAYSLKLNLFKGKNSDPMLNTDFIVKIRPKFDVKEGEILLHKAGLEDELKRNGTSKERKAAIINEIEQIDAQLELIDTEQIELIKKAQKEFADKYWNASMLDIGFGQIFNYKSASIDSLDFLNKGKVLWINGAFGMGKNILLTGLYKNFILSENNDYMLGLNLKFGNSKIKFFTEGIYESVVKKDKFTFGYGGDFKLNPNLSLQFGIRTEYNKDLKLKDIIPLVNINWIMKN